MAEGRMNLAALQQRDPYISEILDTASQVALYSFNSKANEWEKTSIEGSLFIYKSSPGQSPRRAIAMTPSASADTQFWQNQLTTNPHSEQYQCYQYLQCLRSASPVNGFMILNRLGLNNLIEPITKDLEFQQQDPFLLYRNAKSIYGVWFYDKDECQRLGHMLNRYVQEILDEHLRKSGVSPSVVRGAAEAEVRTEPAKMAGHLPQSQVDIMQMLSKAQEEYDTGSTNVTGARKKKTEPKPMIDNPNASATKSNNIIRPMPLKMPDTDSQLTETDEVGSTTPGTGIISLDALFRTASLQQGGGAPKFPTNVTTKSSVVQRSVSMTTSASLSSDYQSTLEPKHLSEGDDLPPLLKHIMSTGSMVEDIERQHGLGSKTSESVTFGLGDETGIPDVSQPPPNHPAYRGPSPNTQARSARKSPRDHSSVSVRTDDNVKIKEKETKSEIKGVPGPGAAPQILSGNLMPQFVTVSSSSQKVSTVSQSKSVRKVPTETVSESRVSPRGDTSVVKSKEKTDHPAVVKSGSLLTPADILQSSISLAPTSSTSTSFVSSLQEKPVNPNLSAAAASLTTELLSPMAFITSTARKTPPVSSVPDRSVTDQKGRDTDALPIAALTKEQLQQALLHLVKNDSSFISTIHEAYLKSLQELAGSKT